MINIQRTKKPIRIQSKFTSNSICGTLINCILILHNLRETGTILLYNLMRKKIKKNLKICLALRLRASYEFFSLRLRKKFRE